MTEPSREILSNSAALNSLKRPQLNRLCKRFGVNAKGKVGYGYRDKHSLYLRVILLEQRTN